MSLTFQKRVELVRAAIEQIDIAIAECMDLQQDPCSSGDQRERAKCRVSRCEDEFGWQWRNVKSILDDMERQDGGDDGSSKTTATT